MRAIAAADGGVCFEWAREVGPPDILGWFVERQGPEGLPVRLNPNRVDAGLFDSPAKRYRVCDPASPASPGASVSCRLVVVDPELREWPGEFIALTVEADLPAPAPAIVKSPRQPLRQTRDITPVGTGARLRITVQSNGLYRLTAAQIAAGLTGYSEAQAAQAIAQTNLALTCGGAAVAWQAEHGGAALLFFGQAYRDPYTDRNVYFLAPGTGLAMATSNRATANVAADPWFWETVVAEQNLFFMAFVPGTLDDDYFVGGGQSLTSPSTTWTWTTNVSLPDLHPGVRQGTVTARLVSGYEGSPALDNRTRLSAAGQLLDDRQWAGDARLAQSGAATNLTGSSVSVSVEMRRETGVTTTTVLIDGVDVRYARRLRALNNQLLFQPESGTNTLTVRGFTNPAIRVFEVTDSLRPVELSATIVEETTSVWRVSWSVNPAATGRYLAAAATLEPEKIEGVAVSTWAAPQAGVPHLVIAPQALTNAAAALVMHRQAQGLNSLLLPVEELYDAFAHGRRDPRAIQRFLAFAYTNWSVPAAYACLAGDGHLDYDDHFEQAATRPNHVPPLRDRVPYTLGGGNTMEFMGLDNPLGDLNGDGNPEVAIGRLPAQDAATLTVMINRIMAHESADDWKNRVLMVADRSDHNEFAIVCNNLETRVSPGMTVQRLNHSAATTPDTMRGLFAQAMNIGPSLALYVGHANNVGISSPYFFEHSYIRSHMSALTNTQRGPLLLAGTCMLNNFSRPQTDARCLGKGFMDTAPGGTMGVWASASSASLYNSQETASAILDELFDHNDLRLGDLLRPALAYEAASIAPWMARSSVLMGDPGARIRTHFVLDLTPPEVQITAPTTNAALTVFTNRINLAGIGSDGVGLRRVKIRNSRVPGETNATGTTSWSLANYPLAEGTNLISAIAYDSAGNSVTAQVELVCRIVPALQITGPTPAATYFSISNRLNLSGTASDQSGLAQVHVRNDRIPGDWTATGTTNWSRSAVELALGTNLITAEAVDIYGNTATATLQVVYDPAFAMRINSGGGAVSNWSADTNWTVASGGGAASSSATIANAGDVPQAVYRTRRYGSTVTYNLSIPDGQYHVRLHFAELAFTAAGQRRFNVAIEGAPVLTNFDILAAAGGQNRAVTRTFENVNVSGGLQIQATGTTSTAQFNGIEVWIEPPRVLSSTTAVAVPEGGTAAFGVRLSKAPAGSVTVAVARVSGDADMDVTGGASLVFNAGNFAATQLVTLAAAEDADSEAGAAVIQCIAAGYVLAAVTATEQDNETPPVDLKINSGGGAVSNWLADTNWTVASGGGAATSTATIANAGDVPQAVYRTRRYGSTVTYNLPIPDGQYHVRLHFAELSFTAAGQRRFNVSIEGAPVLANFDILAAAGGKNRAVVQVFSNVTVSGGLQIQAVGTTSTAQFNGLEVWTAGPPAPQVVASPAAVAVPEGGMATFGVTLNVAPAGAVTVAVAQVSGDADLAVTGGASLVFTPGNFATTQLVTLAAAEDGDSVNGAAGIECTAAGHGAAAVTATEQDNDTPPVDLKINSGGGAVSNWLADTNWTMTGGGTASSTATIANAGEVPQGVYRTRRYGSTVTYNLPIPDGQYHVRLHFAELSFTAAGQRRFNVSIEGGQVLANFDILAAAGGKDRAVVQVFSNVTVSGGLQIQAVGTTSTAQFNGLEVWTAGPPAPRIVAAPAAVAVPEGGAATFGVTLNVAPAGAVTVAVAQVSGDADLAVTGGASLVFTPGNFATTQLVTLAAAEDADSVNGAAGIECTAAGHGAAAVTATEQDNDTPPVDLKINSGGGAVSNWLADTNWTMTGGGTASSTATIANAGDVPQAVYRTRRYGSTLTYSLAIPDGQYHVRLHFAELAYTAAGQRRFNVSIEGGQVLTNFDILAAAGGKDRAIVQVFSNVTVSGGLQIQAVGTTGTAQFNGLEVVSAGGSGGARSRSLARVPSEDAAASISAVSRIAPVAVARSGEGDWIDASVLVDGDPETGWSGEPGVATWSVALDFEEPIDLADCGIVFADEAWLDCSLLGSADLENWFVLGPATAWPVACRAVFIQLRAGTLDGVPVLREIQWSEEPAP